MAVKIWIDHESKYMKFPHSSIEDYKLKISIQPIKTKQIKMIRSINL